MAKKLASFGYDLGDGETIVDAVTTDQNLKFKEISNLQMPGESREGVAIPTGYGYDAKSKKFLFAPSILHARPENVTGVHAYFKRRPTDLMGGLSDSRRAQLREVFKSCAWPSKSVCPEAYSEDFMYFEDAVRTFTNAFFSYPKFLEQMKTVAKDKEEIVFCVGHPTRWDELDVLIYKAILKRSVLGQDKFLGTPSSMLLAAESRAAYLYMRDLSGNVKSLPRGTCCILVDVGSSTIDVTAVTADSRNAQYNSGNNDLGVRGIDFMIRNWFLESAYQEDSRARDVYQDMVQHTPTLPDILTLKCRDAKEKICSVDSEVDAAETIYLGAMPPQELTTEVINRLAETVPLAPILLESGKISRARAAELGNQSWVSLFRQFLKTQKAEIEKQGLKIGRAIMTGSATKMPFVPPIVREVFGELSGEKAGEILKDPSPSRSISRGLALVGPSNEKSKQFQKDVRELIDKDVPDIIAKDLPQLADSVASEVETIVGHIIRSRMESWRDGWIDTIDEMVDRIKSDCSEKNLTAKLNESESYKQAVKNWTVNVVGKDIALKLQDICKAYDVSEFSLTALNVMQGIKFDPVTGGVTVNPGDPLVDVVGDIVAAICGFVAALMVVDIAALVIVIVGFISADLAMLIFATLVAMGPIGWGVLALVLGVGVAALVRNGFDGFKQAFAEKVQGWNLPTLARKIVTDGKISEQISNANIKSKVKSAMLEEKNKKQIVKSVSAGLEDQIQKRADDIKFVIESRN